MSKTVSGIVQSNELRRHALSYLLVMVAMVTTPVTYVAPAREVSILIGARLSRRR
jgi:hypothetical protein